MNLTDLSPGDSATITSIAPCELAGRLIDLGFLGGVRCIMTAGRGGMCAYLVGGTLIALRPTDAQHVRVAAHA